LQMPRFYPYLVELKLEKGLYIEPQTLNGFILT